MVKTYNNMKSNDKKMEVNQFKLEMALDAYKNVPTDKIKSYIKSYRFLQFLYRESTQFLLFWLCTMLPSGLMFLIAGINPLTIKVAVAMFCIYPILFYAYKKTILKNISEEHDKFLEKEITLEYILESRENKKGAE